MLMILVWALVGILLGLCLIIVTPWTAAQIAGRDWQENVSDKYVWLAQTAARRCALIVRDGDVKLVPKRYDSDLKGDKDSATGDDRHHFDAFDAVSRLKNRVFGFGLTSRDAYVSPLLAELGEAAKQARERNQIGHEEAKGTTDKIHDGIHIPERSQLVDLAAARHLTSGSSEPEAGQESYEKTKISQEKFHQRVSFGQGILIVIAAIGSMGAAWLAASRGGGSVAPDTTVSLVALLALPAIRWERVAAALYVLAWLVVVPVLALVTYGPLTCLIVIVTMLSIALAIPGFIALFGPSLPTFLGIPIARGFWILAQLTVGRGVLVERDSGELEHRKLLDAPDDADHDCEYEAVLSDGKVLPIDGSKGDLFRFAWAPLGACAEKSVQNMGQITEEAPDDAANDDGEILPQNTRQGYQPAIREPVADSWLVTLPQLWTWCEGTAESTAVRQGRSKALTDYGGEQQISGLAFYIMLLAAIMIGGLFGLIAGGAIL